MTHSLRQRVSTVLVLCKILLLILAEVVYFVSMGPMMPLPPGEAPWGPGHQNWFYASKMPAFKGVASEAGCALGEVLPAPC